MNLRHTFSSITREDFFLFLGQEGQLQSLKREVAPPRDTLVVPSVLCLPHTLKIVQLASGDFSHLALLTDGSLVTWNEKQYTEPNSCVPRQVPFPAAKKIQMISCGADFSAVLSTDGNIYTWGQNDYGPLGLETEPTLVPPPAPHVRYG